jgi:hypothetical protein
MLAAFEHVLDRLDVASRNGEKAMCFCPAHDDRNNPSLSLKAENGRLLVHCFAGCQPEDIISEIGLEMKDLFTQGEGGLLFPQTCLHTCTLQARRCISKRKTGVQALMHTPDTAAHSKSTHERKSFRKPSYKAWG